MPLITLLKPHRHAGKDYPVGAELAVSEPDAAWLVSNQICRGDRPGSPDDGACSPSGQTNGSAPASEPASKKRGRAKPPPDSDSTTKE